MQAFLGTIFSKTQGSNFSKTQLIEGTRGFFSILYSNFILLYCCLLLFIEFITKTHKNLLDIQQLENFIKKHIICLGKARLLLRNSRFSLMNSRIFLQKFNYYYSKNSDHLPLLDYHPKKARVSDTKLWSFSLKLCCLSLHTRRQVKIKTRTDLLYYSRNGVVTTQMQSNNKRMLEHFC